MENKIAEIERIVNNTLAECGGQWLSLEEQLEMAIAFADENYPADVEWYEQQIAERDAKIAAVLA